MAVLLPTWFKLLSWAFWLSPGLRLGHDHWGQRGWCEPRSCSLAAWWPDCELHRWGAAWSRQAAPQPAYLWEQKGPDMWHRLPNLRGFNWLSGSIVHQIKRGNISTCLLISSKGLNMQTSTAHSRCSRICSADKKLVMRTPWERECSAIFGCIVHWRGEWRNWKANLTAPDKGSAFLLRPTYINLLLLLLWWMYIFIHLSALVSKGRGWL